MAGRIAVAFDNVLSSSPGIAGGQLRALAVSGSRRTPSLPDVPTVAESGLPGFDVTVWQGVLFPTGVDPAITARLSAEMATALQSPEIRARLSILGVDAIGSNPVDYSHFLDAEYRRWGDVIQRSGARVD